MTANVGGSFLLVGSAASVALMGQAQGMYSFFSHVKWSRAIAQSKYAHFFDSYLTFHIIR